MYSAFQHHTLTLLIICGTAWSWADTPPSSPVAGPCEKRQQPHEPPREESKGPKRQRPDAPSLGGETEGSAGPGPPPPHRAPGPDVFTRREIEKIEQLRAKESISPTPLSGVLQSLKENEDLLSPDKLQEAPKGGYFLIPWLDNYILKTGTYDRLDHAKQIRETIIKYGCHSFFVPEKIPYKTETFEPMAESTKESDGVAYIVEKIQGETDIKFSLDEVVQFHKIILATRYTDIHSDNFIRTKDGRIAMIDTGWQDADKPREMNVAKGCFL